MTTVHPACNLTSWGILFILIIIIIMAPMPAHDTYTCIAGDCADPGVPQNGGVTDYNTASGSTITFYCDSGFTLHGSSTSQCVSGEWTPRPEDVLCIPEHDNVTPTPSGMFHNKFNILYTKFHTILLVYILCQSQLQQTIVGVAVH